MGEEALPTRRELRARPPRWRDRNSVEQAAAAAMAFGLGVLVVLAVIRLEPVPAGTFLLGVSAAYVFHGLVARWTSMLFILSAVIMFVPIRRYALPVNVGFALEPYRLLIVGLIVAVAIALLTGRLVWKRVVWGWPIALFLWLMYASLMVNAVSATVSGAILSGFSNIVQLTFLLSVIVLVRQLLTDKKQVIALLTFLVFAGSVIAFFAFVERYTHFNIFMQLQRFLPLELLRDDALSLRAGGNRSYASSQHPIALSVLFCMLTPIAVYLSEFGRWPRHPVNRRLVYLVAIGVMMVGLLSAVSRTGVVVLGAMFLFTLLIRPRLAGTLLLLSLPVAGLAALLFPKLFRSTVLSLLDFEALIASQRQAVGLPGQGRLADIGPAMSQLGEKPWFGTGLGSRVVVGDQANAQILDNQWLGTLMETGLVGMIGMVALLTYPVVRMVRFSFTSGVPLERAFLTFAIAASALGYAVAAYFYDAFSFMQTLLLLCILLAVGAWAMTDKVAPRPPTARGASMLYHGHD